MRRFFHAVAEPHVDTIYKVVAIDIDAIVERIGRIVGHNADYPIAVGTLRHLVDDGIHELAVNPEVALRPADIHQVGGIFGQLAVIAKVGYDPEIPVVYLYGKTGIYYSKGLYGNYWNHCYWDNFKCDSYNFHSISNGKEKLPF